MWRPHGDGLLNYNVNSKVTLAQDSKGKLSLVDNPVSTVIAPKTEPNNHQFDKAQKQEIASYIGQQKELLQFCWKEALMIEGPCTEESIEKLVMALYLSAQRKFKLA